MPEEKVDFHNNARRIVSNIEKIKNEERILAKNKKKILEFIDSCRARNLANPTLSKDCYALWYIGFHLQKDFTKCKRLDIEKLCTKINNQKAKNKKTKEEKDWSPETKRNHKVIMKKLFQWLYSMDKGEYPDCVKWVETTLKESQTKLPEDLLTEDDIKALMSACENIRDKTLISLLFETGCRVGELLNIRLKHIEIINSGNDAFVMLNGKTGMRRVPIVVSIPPIASYMAIHPFRKTVEEGDDPNYDPNSFLFLTRMYRTKGTKGSKSEWKPLGYTSVRKILFLASKKAGIKKNIHPHLFRHSSATINAKYFTDAQMRAYHGWSKSSRTPSIYTHLSAKDMVEAVNKKYGRKTEESKPKFTIIDCPRCQRRNSPDAKFCAGCALPLTKEASMQLKTAQTDSNITVENLQKISKMDVEKILELSEMLKKMEFENYKKKH